MFGRSMLAGLLIVLVFAGTSQAQEVLPSPAAVASMTRTVVVNLSVDRENSGKSVQLKTRDGEILAEASDKSVEKLEYEVSISGPTGYVRAYFDVSKDSNLYSAYHRYKDKDPEKILSFMDTVRSPVVRVVAVRRVRPVEFYLSGRLNINHVKDPWKPFYEVCLPDAALPHTVLVPVREDDDPMYDLMYRTVARRPKPLDVVFLAQISGSGCEYCCGICRRFNQPCDGPHCPPQDCHCASVHRGLQHCQQCGTGQGKCIGRCEAAVRHLPLIPRMAHHQPGKCQCRQCSLMSATAKLSQQLDIYD